MTKEFDFAILKLGTVQTRPHICEFRKPPEVHPHTRFQTPINALRKKKETTSYLFQMQGLLYYGWYL